MFQTRKQFSSNKVKLLLLIIVTLLGIQYLMSREAIDIVQAETTKTATNWNVAKLTSSTGDNIKVLNYSNLSIDKVKDIYNTNNQKTINKQMEELKQKENYSLDKPLLVSNPYLTNSTGLYIYFKTQQPVSISYEIKAKGYHNFKMTLYNKKGTYATEHEYQIIGSISGVKNNITLTATEKDGSQKEYTFNYKPNALQSLNSNKYKVKNGKSKAKLSLGLFAVIGNQSSQTMRSTYFIDNSGTVRAEIPIIGYNSMRLNQTSDNQLYLAINADKIAKISNLGQVNQVIDIGSQGYSLHHDFVLDNDNNLLALATNLKKSKNDNIVEDQILKIDTSSGKITNTIDMENLLPELYEKATDLEKHSNESGKRDPIHLNTIQNVGKETIIVSSRETSTIMKITNLDNKPSISYLISDKSVWKGVGNYSDLLLKQSGNFINSAGQHTVTYEKDSSLSGNQYYLYMFNNNYNIMDSRSDFDWSAYESDKKTDVNDSVSLYYKYLVDEDKGTYELVDSFKVPYSPYVSSAQDFGDNIIVAPGRKNTFIEYDKNGKAIRRFTFPAKSRLTYRTLKYRFTNFYFSNH